MIAGPGVPSEIRAALARYVEHHIPTGGFLRAVLENDLVGAVGRADAMNLERLPSIVAYIYEHLPRACWGSPLAVGEWLRERTAQLAQERTIAAHRRPFGEHNLLGPEV